MVYTSKNQTRNKRWDSYIEQAQNGNLNAFEHLVQELRPRLIAYCGKYGFRTQQDIEDLVEETILALFEKLNTIHPTNVSSYTYTITRNGIIDQKRRTASEHCIEFRFEDVPDSFSLENRILNPEEAKFLLGIGLPKLSEEQRTVLTLSSEGMNYREIADVLNIPVNTVKTRILRGKRKLKKAIGPLIYQQV